MNNMGITRKFIIVLTLASVSDLSLAACPKQKFLEDILSPANAERAIQILRLATVGANVINPTGPGLLDGLAPPRCLPGLPSIAPIAPSLPTIVPSKQLLPNYPPRPLPRPVISQPIVEVAPVYPQIAPPVVAPTVIQEKVYPAMPIPQPCSAPAVPVMYPPPPAPCQAAPVPLVNPFLPAASPVSAMAPPTSSLLPPVVPTQVRSNFLRKIPIPPPSL